MTAAFGWKVGAGLVATLFAGWAAAEFATRYRAMQLAQEYGHVRSGAINAPEVRITTVEGAEKLIPHLDNVPDLYKVGVYAVPLKADQLIEISKLHNVDTLHLGACSLSDQEVEILAEMPHLIYLDISGNPLTDKALKSIAKIESLEQLDLSKTDVEGHLLGELQNLPRLRVIRLANTKVNDSTLDELAKVTSIEDVSLTNTEISAVGLMELASLHRLRLLALPEERIYGNASHDNISQFKEAKWKFMAEFNELKREKYKEAIAEGLEVPDRFVSPFPEKRLK